MQIVLGYWPFRQPTVSVTAGGNFQWNFPPHQRWMRLHLDDFSTSLTPTLEIVDECRGLYTATARNTLTFLGWISLKNCMILFAINIYPREFSLSKKSDLKVLELFCFFSLNSRDKDIILGNYSNGPNKHVQRPIHSQKLVTPTWFFSASKIWIFPQNLHFHPHVYSGPVE